MTDRLPGIPPSYEQRMRHRRALQRRRARIRRHRLIALGLVSIVGLASYGLVSIVSTPIHTSAPPPYRLESITGPSIAVGGHLAKLSWPDQGEGAVGLQGGSIIGASPRQREVPIASMTKMMTALVVVHDHPLLPGKKGPTLTMTAADALAWTYDAQHDDATVPVDRGEQLSEYQLLEALLIPSGDNIADLLATWDATTMAKFVAKMNAYAKSLALKKTVYADASGVNPRSRSTPADQVVVTGVLMESPVLRGIVERASVPFPIAGTLHNVNPVLGVDGIIGVKSGFTNAAGGCLATAAERTIGGKQVLVIAVATGSLDGLYGAGRIDRQLLQEVRGSLVALKPTSNQLSLSHTRLLGTTPVLMHIAGGSPTLVAWKGVTITSHIVLSVAVRKNVSHLSATLIYTSPTGVLGTAQLSDAVTASAQ